MRIITWNVRKAYKDSPVWDLVLKMKPDIALLQEVGSMPETVKSKFSILSKKATTKTGKPQIFSTAVLVKGKIIEQDLLKSDIKWVNLELDFFKGNLVSYKVQLKNRKIFNVVSVHSPAWAINPTRLKGCDLTGIKLVNNSKVWATEIVWSALKNVISVNEQWIVGGDYNSSILFDVPHDQGNQEIIDRMYELGFKECLSEYHEKPVPTFKNVKPKKLIHQLDKLFVQKKLFAKMKKCIVGDKEAIIDNYLSDHLPIIADFKDN